MARVMESGGESVLTLAEPGAGGRMLAALARLVAGATEVSVAVSYLKLSGWALLAPLLREGATVRVLCTDQMAITDPAAVRAMQAAGVEVRCWAGAATFHPKLYLANSDGGSDEWLLGSANLSWSALKTGIEAGCSGDDVNGAASAWFERLWGDTVLVQPFDDARLKRLDQARTRKFSRNLAFLQIGGEDLPGVDELAAATVEMAFATLQGELMPLNIDKGGSTVRTLRYVERLLHGPKPMADAKAAGDMRRLGFGDEAGYLTSLGRTAAEQSDDGIEAIATHWIAWLKAADEATLLALNPTGRLVRGRQAFATFWSFAAEVTEYFLTNCTGAAAASEARALCQTIELLANAGRALPGVRMRDVRTLSTILSARDALPDSASASIDEYLVNRGARGWGEPDRRILLLAWRDVA